MSRYCDVRCVADPETGAPTTETLRIDDVAADEYTLLLFLDGETRRILLEVPNALGWRLHYGARGKDVAAAVAASGVVGAGPAEVVGLMLFTFRGAPDRAMRVRVHAVAVAAPQPAGAFVAYEAVPYESMWRDDALWLPGVLDGSGRAFAGHFVFAGGPGRDAPLVAHNCASSPRNDAPLVACVSSELPVRSYYRGSAPRAGTVAVARRAGRDVAAAALLAAIDPAADLARWAPLAYDDGRGGWVPLDDVATVRVDAAEARVEFVDRCQSAAIATPPRDGFFGVGIVRGKTGGNDGVLWRSAAQLGAAFSFSVGARFGRLDGATDAIDAWRTVPNFRYDSFADFAKSSPRGAAWVAVEMGGEPLETFVHPDRAVYFLGAEDHGVPKDVLRACRHVVALPAARSASYNVAVAGALVMYDRLSKRNRPAAAAPPPRSAVRDDAPERDAPARLPVVLFQRDAAAAPRVAAYLRSRHGLAAQRPSARPGDADTLGGSEIKTLATLGFAVASPGDGDAARAAAAVARDPVIAGAAVPRILVLERRAAGLEGIGLDPALAYRVAAAPKALERRVVAALPEAIRLDPVGATHVLSVVETDGGVLYGVAARERIPAATPGKPPAGFAVLEELARRGALPPAPRGAPVVVLPGCPPGFAAYLARRGDAVDAGGGGAADGGGGGGPVAALFADGGDAPARAVEVAAGHLPRLDGPFVFTVAPRHRRTDADLADDARARLEARFPTLRAARASCLWLFANAKFERTVVVDVRPRAEG